MKPKEFEKILKSLASKRRIAIISFLKNKKEATVGLIAEKINLSFKSTSKHLDILASADLVDKEQRNTQCYYKISSQLPELASKIISLL